MHNKYANIQNTKDNIDNEGVIWTNKTFTNPYATIRLATSFSGIGAIEHAFKRLGLNTKIQFAGDIDKECKKAYFANYDIKEEQWHNDIYDLDARPFRGDIDLLVGGAPCQAFSIRGKRGGFEDTRGTLFSEFARIVIECQPKVFIFENVKGLLNHNKGQTWDVIKRTFEDDCNYQIYFQTLNSKDYGIPQSRERIYCIGFREETKFKYPAPIKLQKSKYDFLERVIDNKYFLKRKGVNFITRSINHQKSYTQINGDIMLCQKRNQQFNWHGDFVFHPLCDTNANNFDATVFNVNDFEENYFIEKDLGKYTLSIGETTSRIISAEKWSDIQGRYRKLTPRECLRLMGFDDSFKIVCSDTETYKQSGNSIVVDVLIALLKQMDISKYGV